MTTVKVSQKNQIAVPAEVRRKLGIHPGDLLRVDVENGKMVLEPQADDWLDRLASIAPEIWQGVDAQEYVRELRDEWSHRER